MHGDCVRKGFSQIFAILLHLCVTIKMQIDKRTKENAESERKSKKGTEREACEDRFANFTVESRILSKGCAV